MSYLAPDSDSGFKPSNLLLAELKLSWLGGSEQKSSGYLLKLQRFLIDFYKAFSPL